MDVSSEVAAVNVGLTFLTLDHRMAAQSQSKWDGARIENRGRPQRVVLRWPNCHLNPGSYYLSLFAYAEDTDELVGHHYAVRKFKVTGGFASWSPVSLPAEWSVGGPTESALRS
jgi:hypothetical protein